MLAAAFLSLDTKASSAQRERYERLTPGGVALWLKSEFKLGGPSQIGKITVSQRGFFVPLKSDTAVAEAVSILLTRKMWQLQGMPVIVSRGSPEKTAEHPAQRNTPPAAGISDDVAKFWRRLQTAVEGGLKSVDTLMLHEPSNQQQWLACWSAAAAGAKSGNREVLIKVLLQAAAKSNVTPPALDVVQVLNHVVEASSALSTIWICPP